MLPLMRSVEGPTGNGSRSRSAQRGRDPLGILEIDVVQQDRELVAAQSGDRVGRADPLAQPPAHQHQQLVPDVVPQRVVDVLEVVQVDQHHHGRGCAGAPSAVALVTRP